ncbi:MAG: MFS transporter [Planctomycetes bacterium]|nr:MFS transporter [Planctomycetota bacterium]
MPEVRDRLPLLLLGVLFLGYACSYFHRADLAALAPLWPHEPGRTALAAALPDLASLGLLVYALGKFAGGVLAERFGGRRLFVLALATAALAELLAAACTAPVPFALCRVLGMAALALAWPSLGHVVASASPRHRLATTMAFLSQSYLLGDAAVRAVLAAVVARGGDSVDVLRTSCAGLAAGALLSGGMFRWLGRRVVAATGGPAPAPSPAEAAPRCSPWRPMLWLAGMNMALALVRESLSFWSPLLLVESCRYAPEAALRASALLPIVSGLGVVLAGPFADRSPRALAVVLVLPGLLGAAGLAWLSAPAAAGPAVVVVLALVSGALAMPTSLASGVLPLRAAGRGGARWLGLVDGCGTLGAVLAGSGIGRVRATFSMSIAFSVLGAVALLSALLAAGYVRRAAVTGPSASDQSDP